MQNKKARSRYLIQENRVEKIEKYRCGNKGRRGY